jgi:hypothetical protein
MPASYSSLKTHKCMELRGREKGMRMIRSTILKYITSVQVEDLRICIESC